MALTFPYTWYRSGSPVSVLQGEYTPGPDGSGPITTVHVTNNWSVDGVFYLIQQFNAADPDMPVGWSDPTGTGVRVWPDEPPSPQLVVGAGQTEQFDVSTSGLVFKVGQTGWYGDEFTTSDGSGPITAGGEIGLVLGS